MDIHILIQKLGFDSVDFFLHFSSALRAVFMNTASHLREIILKISLSNSPLLNRNVYRKKWPLLFLLAASPLLGQEECYPPSAWGGRESGFSLSVDFLYLKAYEDQLAYTAITTPNSTPIPTTLFNQDFVDLSFDWNPGVRVGLGYLFCHDCWDLNLNWMYYKTKPKNSISRDTPSLALLVTQDQEHAVESGPFPLAQKAKAEWEMKLNQIDLDLGKKYCLSCAVALRPHFGLKTAWIDQSFSADYEDIFRVIQFSVFDFLGSTSYVGSGDFWGIGPQIGVDTTWYLGCGFDLFANISGALLTGWFSPSGKIQEDNPTLAPNIVHQKITVEQQNRLRPVVESAFGLEWNTCFCECYFFNLAVGYEVHYFWNQLAIPTPGTVFPNADLALHGLLASIRLDF